MRKWEKILIFVFAVSVCIGIVLINVTDTPEIVINEVCTRNGSIGVDEESIGIDYIELYNTADKMISLSGWYLSDDKKNPTKHCLPEIYIDPGTSMLFYATGESGKENEVNFLSLLKIASFFTFFPTFPQLVYIIMIISSKYPEYYTVKKNSTP